MVATTTLARSIVTVVVPIASMKACWLKVDGSGLLFRPPPQRPLPRFAIYICQIEIESYIVSKKMGGGGGGDQV